MKQWGTSPTGARPSNGSRTYHIELEEKIAAGGTVEALTVAQLRQLIVGRGGTVPTASVLGMSVLKADLRDVAKALSPMTAAQRVLALQPSAPLDADGEDASEEEAEDEVVAAAAHPEASTDASIDMDVDGEIDAAVDASGL